MDDKKRLAALENVLAQMLKPVRNIPFNIIVKSLSTKEIIKFDASRAADARLLEKLKIAIKLTAEAVRKTPICRPRPNEVGNDIEPFVMKALKDAGLKAQRPTSSAGQGKSTGYPDILVLDEESRPTYIECKIFAEGAASTTMRSFYLSPSESFKVTLSARHLLLAFGMSSEPIANSRDSQYRPQSFKLVDLHDLLCDVKYEFNSDNRRLYVDDLVLLYGNV